MELLLYILCENDGWGRVITRGIDSIDALGGLDNVISKMAESGGSGDVTDIALS
jgi:hypothetical protein